MSTQLGWSEIALRLALTVMAGALIGLNRERHGHSAGLRTTMLVCLAASLSMIQVNLLLGMSGKTPSSFAVMDLMRLPLGILSGMGFIGAGAILRKDTLITGVTTAATLWFSTVMGLCFGGGQLGLGLAAFALGFLIIWGLKKIESRLNDKQQGLLTLTLQGDRFPHDEVLRRIAEGQGKITHWMNAVLDPGGKVETQSCQIICQKPQKPGPPPFLKTLAELPEMIRVEWKATGHGS